MFGVIEPQSETKDWKTYLLMRSCLPSDEELAKLYRWTLHAKWGVSGAPSSGICADLIRCYGRRNHGLI